MALSDERYWDDPGPLLRVAHAAYASAVARAAATEAIESAEVLRSLRWSNAAGYLIQIRMQTAVVQPAETLPLGLPVLLGVGTDPLEAAVAARERRPLLLLPTAGMRFAPEASFYIWVQRHRFSSGADGVRYAKTTPQESAELQDRVDALVKTTRKDELLSARRIRIMEGVRGRFAQQHNSIAAVARVDAALDEYREAFQLLRSGQAYSADLAKWANASDRASGLVRDYQNVLTLQALKVQAQAMVPPKLQTAIRKAKNAGALIKVLSDDQALNRQLAEKQDLPTRSGRERVAYHLFVESLLLPVDEAKSLFESLGLP